MYNSLLSVVNTLFNKQLGVLFGTIPPVINDSYYLATGIDLSKSKCIFRSLGPANDALYTTRDIPTAKYPYVYIIKTNDENSHNILYIDNRITFICFVPMGIDDDDFDPIERIRIVHSIYKYVIGNTATIVDDDKSIMSVAQNVLSEYLTIITMNMCFAGFEYKMFREIKDFNKISQRQYIKILNTDSSVIFNYSYIYAIMQEED